MDLILPLAKSFARLQQASGWIAENGLSDPRQAAGASSDYLRLFGIVALGFMWARMAKVSMLEINLDQIDWKPKIVKTIATKNKGIKELYGIVCKHQNYLNENKSIKKYNLRYSNRVNDLLAQQFKNTFWNAQNKKKLFEELNKDFKNQLSPYSFVKEILKHD